MTYKETDGNGQSEQERPFPPETIGRFNERLKEVMHGQGARSFARKVKLSEGAIRSYLSGETFPTLDRLAMISSAAEVDPQWLAFGGPKDGRPESPDGMDDYAFVPLYDAQCSAGDGSWNENSRVLTYLSFTRYSLRRKGLTPDHLSAIRIDGDSMEPVLNSGDTVLIDHTRASVEGEGIYVLRLDGHLYAKRLQRNFDGVMVISENKHYQPISVPKDRLDELEVIGKAVWSAGWL